MTKASTKLGDTQARFFHWHRGSLFLGALLACTLLNGCVTLPFFGDDKLPDGPAVDNLVLRSGLLEQENVLLDPKTKAELDGARRYYQDKEYAKAEPLFHKVSKAKKIPPQSTEEAIYYEGECQRMLGDYRQAEATYKSLLKEFHHGQFTDQSNQRLFDIANYWLDDTRRQMAESEEKRDGKRWFVAPVSYINFSKDKPTVDIEGHALQCLEEVRLNDIGGPLGEKALFYIATVKFYREDYRDADYYYSQLYDNYPSSPLAHKAIKQAIICKQMFNSGTSYDCRGVEESRKLIDVAARSYPEISAKDDQWIQRQLGAINLQQADRDYNFAEFYRRTGHPGSAYFYYELVRRRYPSTEYAQKATARMYEIHDDVEREQAAQAAGQSSWLTGLWGNTPTRVGPAVATAPLAAPVNLSAPTTQPSAAPNLLPPNLNPQ